MKVIFHRPQNQLLSKFIEGYYIISEDSFNEKFEYYTFPNNYSILSFFQNTDIEIKDNLVNIDKSSNNNISSYLTLCYKKPIRVVYRQAINEITIYFKPLGLNHFIDPTLLFGNQIVEDIQSFDDFKLIFQEFFNEYIIRSKVEMLEDYLISKFQKKSMILLESILKDVECNMKIDDIALKHNFTKQYINKIFRKHLGKTPTEYRKIHRFRSSMLNFNKTANLTSLASDSLFYDQSHFNKDFKEFAKGKPSQIMKKMTVDEKIVWLFL